MAPIEVAYNSAFLEHCDSAWSLAMHHAKDTKWNGFLKQGVSQKNRDKTWESVLPGDQQSSDCMPPRCCQANLHAPIGSTTPGTAHCLPHKTPKKTPLPWSEPHNNVIREYRPVHTKSPVHRLDSKRRASKRYDPQESVLEQAASGHYAYGQHGCYLAEYLGSE